MMTADAGSAGLILLVGLIDAIVWAVAMGRILWRDSVTWKHGWWSRIAWILVASLITWHLIPAVAIPVGAMAAIWRTRTLPVAPAPDPVPMAEGTPGSGGSTGSAVEEG